MTGRLVSLTFQSLALVVLISAGVTYLIAA